MKINSNGLSFEVVVDDPPAHVPTTGTVLLTMGVGMQLVAWPEAFVNALLQAGYRVVRYDNRDIGLSTHLDALGTPSIPWQFVKYKLGFHMAQPYTLQDMANDALGLLDALGVHKAHLVGVSLGGMVSQRLAATAPQRVCSLTSIMSSSGAPGLPGPTPEVVRAMMRRPTGTAPNNVVDDSLRLLQLIGSPAFRDDAAHLRDRLMAGVTRSYHPEGVLRQTLAVMSDTDRHLLLPRITCPTLVIHGTADLFVPLVCGQDTAQRIPGALFEAIEGMGHDWPPAVLPLWLRVLLPHLAAAR